MIFPTQKQLFTIFIVFIGLLSNIAFGKECVDKYCWTDDESMLIAAEKKFEKDQYKGVHKHKFTKTNQCKYHISSIAYAFTSIESGFGKSKTAKATNNLFSLKKGSGKYQYIWKTDYGILTGSNYLKYPTRILSVLDFMYTFKYGYGCDTSLSTINVYKTGKTKGDANSERYYKNLIDKITYFENKYFGKNSKEVVFVEEEIKHGSAAVKKDTTTKNNAASSKTSTKTNTTAIKKETVQTKKTTGTAKKATTNTSTKKTTSKTSNTDKNKTTATKSKTVPKTTPKK